MDFIMATIFLNICSKLKLIILLSLSLKYIVPIVVSLSN